MNNEQLREHIINDIKELKQHIIVIEDLLRELRIFYITNKGNYDYKSAYYCYRGFTTRTSYFLHNK